jgi:hypothetical protein
VDNGVLLDLWLLLLLFFEFWGAGLCCLLGWGTFYDNGRRLRDSSFGALLFYQFRN